MNKSFFNNKNIDINDIVRTVLNYKIFIVLVTLLVMFSTFVYQSSTNTLPLYKGKVLVELGKGLTKEGNIVTIDKSSNLKYILKKSFNVKVNTYRDSSQLLEIVSIGKNKDKVKEEITNALTYIMDRNKERIPFYDKYIIAKIISDIKFVDNYKKLDKKKLLVVSFFLGLILSVFLVFLIEYIKIIKEDRT